MKVAKDKYLVTSGDVTLLTILKKVALQSDDLANIVTNGNIVVISEFALHIFRLQIIPSFV